MVLVGFRCQTTEGFDLGFGIVDFGRNSKGHGAEGIAIEVSEISELSTCTLCAMRFALCAIASSIQRPVTSDQTPGARDQ